MQSYKLQLPELISTSPNLIFYPHPVVKYVLVMHNSDRIQSMAPKKFGARTGPNVIVES
jgi:hypothetical protein